jgi:DNA-binding IclR family transcriptional regulator
MKSPDRILSAQNDDAEAPGGARRDYKVPAAEKALDILEFMAARNDDVTQTEISAGLGRSIHEIYRVIQFLEGRGYLVRTKPDRFRLSLKLFELAHMHPPVNRLIDCALPVMRELVGKTDQSCHLVVLRDAAVLIVLQVDSPLPMRYSVALGSHFPVLETSSGAVLLAALRPPEREALLERIIASGEAGADRAGIAARLSKIDKLGYEMRASLAVEGCTNISVPVHDHMGAAIAALTVPYLPQTRARFDRQSALASARAAANEISRALGAPEPAGRNRATWAGCPEPVPQPPNHGRKSQPGRNAP